MPSPFPGMDPYLEDAALWPAFHRLLVTCLHQILLSAVAARYRTEIAQRRYTVEPDAESAQQERQEDFLEIRQQSDGRLVTLLEVVSPTNKSLFQKREGEAPAEPLTARKPARQEPRPPDIRPSGTDSKTSAEGRTAYLDKRRESKGANANLVEIDLVLQGQPTLEYSRDGLPDWDYAVTVTRSTQSERYEIYTATLQKRLPRFRLPLAADDRDAVLDLYTAFTRCYDQGGFASRIDYKRDPTAPLTQEDRRWLDDVLVQQKMRSRIPLEEEIARAAYFLWEQEGRPHGRDQEHWRRAREQLSR